MEWADLGLANLGRADLSGADMSGADLLEANLQEAALSEVNLLEANLSGAKLGGADLSLAKLHGTKLQGVDIEGAKLWYTIFAEVDLGQVRGLDMVIHVGPSTIGIDTLYLSGGNIPEAFLRGCGVPDSLIEYARSLVGKAIEYYSCFISYSSHDEECARRLYADLQANNVRCWFAPHDMDYGARIRPTLDDAIRLHDKVVLLLSETSVRSQWVEQEVEVMKLDMSWLNYLRNTRNIGDFSRWKEHDAYQEAFGRMLRALKAGT